MKVLIVEPGKYPREADIEHTLEAEQAVVGGTIEAVYPWRDSACIVCNDNGIAVREKSRKTEMFVNNFKDSIGSEVPYVSKEEDNFKGIFTRKPKREEIPITIQEQLIVEFYSK